MRGACLSSSMLRRSKTDQEGAGQKVGVPHGAGEDTCPVQVLRIWLWLGWLGRFVISRSRANKALYFADSTRGAQAESL